MRSSLKRKRGGYGVYDGETRAKIARYAIDNGVAGASRYFSTDLGRKVSETTVRSMRDAYVRVRKQHGDDPKTLARSPRGAPTLLGDLEGEVQQYIRRVRVQGGVINARTVMAAVEDIVEKNARHKLRKNGGHIVITSALAKSILRRMGLDGQRQTKPNKERQDNAKIQ